MAQPDVQVLTLQTSRDARKRETQAPAPNEANWPRLPSSLAWEPWKRVCPPRASPHRQLHLKWGKTKRNADPFWFLNFLTQARSPVISQHSRRFGMARVREAIAKCGAPCSPPRTMLPAGSPARGLPWWVGAWLKRGSPPSSRFSRGIGMGSGAPRPPRCGTSGRAEGGLLSDQLRRSSHDGRRGQG